MTSFMDTFTASLPDPDGNLPDRNDINDVQLLRFHCPRCEGLRASRLYNIKSGERTCVVCGTHYIPTTLTPRRPRS